LLKVDPASGEVTVVAAFDGLPSPLPNPNRGGAMEADPVPTGVTFDSEGNAYVSFLSGFPFVPGSTKVVKVSADGQVSDYATGLTMLTDLRTGPDGNMYAVQFGLFTEQGPDPISGAILRIKEGDASEVLVKGLSFPTSIDFNADGDAYVTVGGVGPPGSGAVVKFSGLTAMEAMAEPAMAEEPAAAEAETEPAMAEEEKMMAEGCQENYVVQADDWLSTIAEKFYGDVTAYPVIFDATNAAAAAGGGYEVIADPNIIEVGQVLCIPAAHDDTQ
jgi:hypothetical protein